jgi:hypothetical protein
VEVKIHVFLTSAVVEGELSASRPGRLTPRERAPPYLLYRKLGGVVEVKFHVFLTLAIDGIECSASLPGGFTLDETAGAVRWLGFHLGTRTKRKKYLSFLQGSNSEISFDGP